MLTLYKSGVPLFIDRPYSDSMENSELSGLLLVKLQRHEERNIRIMSKKPFTIYRMISNNKNSLLHEYQTSKIEVNVVGRSVTLSKVVKKDFKPGSYILSPGGPIASSPILIGLDKEFTTYPLVDFFY